MWKDFFYFSRRERQGVLLLLVFIAGIFLGKYIFSPSNPEALNESKLVEENDFFVVASETPEETQIPFYNRKQTKSRKYVYNPPSQKEKRTYYVQEKDTVIPPAQTNYPKTEKWSEGETIELNAADSLDLKKLPGIGSAFAKRIVNYRKLLGGYYCVEQLQEVYGMYEELYEQILPYLTVNPNEIERISVNIASLDKLKNHPYINFYQAKAIIEMRKKKGKLDKIDELKLLEEFSIEDRMRIEPYLEFQLSER
ncbi:MAG: helix-hairpin-helix domain-containing protein [Dysgonamonadaceae bacterium]|jgi:competence ComEA-like helix-hairpin-helix protein|nr:helix-hairpin-helix domain-containing protein [Dysgonamonadaceae bacterium]